MRIEKVPAHATLEKVSSREIIGLESAIIGNFVADAYAGRGAAVCEVPAEDAKRVVELRKKASRILCRAVEISIEVSDAQRARQGDKAPAKAQGVGREGACGQDGDRAQSRAPGKSMEVL